MSRDAPTMDELYGVGAEAADAQAQAESDFRSQASIKAADRLILAAEKDLGPLSNGQCRDLLLDNTEMDSNDAAYIVAILRPRSA